jgi:hypothetical protein
MGKIYFMNTAVNNRCYSNGGGKGHKRIGVSVSEERFLTHGLV